LYESRVGDYFMRAFFLTIALALVLCGAAFGGARSDCTWGNLQGDKDRELLIRGCTLIIDGQVAGDTADAYHIRGRVYSDKDENDRAIADYDQAIRLDPKGANAYFNRAAAFRRKGDYDRAVTDYDQFIRLKPTDPDGYYYRGTAYDSEGDYDRAIADYDQAIRLDPKDSYPYERRGNSHYNKGDYDSAVADYDQALRLKPDLADAARFRNIAIAKIKEISATKPSLPPRNHLIAARRVALVIGNGTYAAVSALPNPKRDSAAVSAELAQLGFEVIEKHDLGVIGMRRALGEFEDKAAGADWALVYYAGHGMELAGQNWLIPTDAVLTRSSDVPDEAVPLDRILERVRAAKKLRIVILDACRNNPFLSRMVMMGGKSRSVDRGLARVEPEHGEVVFYSARDGSVASDGDGEHSPFAAALLKHMSEDGVELGRFFRRVTSTVLSSTNPKQEPFMYGRLPDEDFYFKPPK
jgi:tetratricopeptide (TPR) repeat protein